LDLFRSSPSANGIGTFHQGVTEALGFTSLTFTQHQVEIKSLSDERQEVYRQLREMSADPLDVDLAKPHMWLQPTTAREADGTQVELQRYEKHLLCDDDGTFPESFNSWEDAETQIRNPCLFQ